VKFGSASVSIYLSESKGRKRYFIAHDRDGKQIRKAFPDLAAAKKEALFVAQRIQSGIQHVTDLKPHERDNYAKAVELLGELKLPLGAAMEDYVQANASWPAFAVRILSCEANPLQQVPLPPVRLPATASPVPLRGPSPAACSDRPVTIPFCFC
jgi:hypothetical protein